MNTQEKREAIRKKVVEAIPSIKSLPSYPYNPDVAKVITKLGEIVAMNHVTPDIAEYVSFNIKIYEKQQQVDYIRMLQNKYEGRPITALDILRALGYPWMLGSNGSIIRFISDLPAESTLIFLDLSQTLDEWSDDTIDKLYELFYE